MDTIIFDLDGTLVQSVQMDSELYVQAVREVLGAVRVHDTWESYEHVTDSGILREILAEAAPRNHESLALQVRNRFAELVTGAVRARPPLPVEGAVAMLDDYRSRRNWQVGIATGGWRSTAEAKLKNVGITPEGLELCTADDHFERTSIMKLCHGRLRQSDRRPIYVGDGPWDLQAATQLGWGFVAIGSRLRGLHSPWIANYGDPAWSEAIEKALEPNG
ncbi:MAG: haloacid dehalogenase-like hydrolase [Thermoanaerobaculia bacterium]|nr:haloacid dehalogenase-like hydrolase [Thermoanaerobaculia bacterium]